MFSGSFHETSSDVVPKTTTVTSPARSGTDGSVFTTTGTDAIDPPTELRATTFTSYCVLGRTPVTSL